MFCSGNLLPQVRHSSEDESKETVEENIILINRQRQVGLGLATNYSSPHYTLTQFVKSSLLAHACVVHLVHLHSYKEFLYSFTTNSSNYNPLFPC